MRKISMWVVALVVIASGVSINGFAQVPTQTAAQTQGQPQTPSPQRMKRRQLFGRDRIARIDADRDGRVSREEWPRNAEVFARLDANNDGFLSADELQAGRQKTFRARKAFGRMDQNHDGQISREEWKGRTEVFDRLDANGDGTVSADEIKARRARTRRELR